MSNQHITIDLATQTLALFADGQIVASYPVSTAANGPGERMDSECTPRGKHVIDETIGDGCAVNTVFVGRRPTGEVYGPDLRAAFPGRDWILTRILWLRGVEPGRNEGGDLDSKARYIYIHGSPDETPMGRPGSRGCIRMRNRDILELFGKVAAGTPVEIV